MKQKLFFLFRSSSMSRTVSSKSSCAIRKPPVISDELSSVTVQIPLSPKGHFQHRDIDPQSWPFMSPPLTSHLDPQHWQRDGEQDLLGFFQLSLLHFHPPWGEISCQLVINSKERWLRHSTPTIWILSYLNDLTHNSLQYCGAVLTWGIPGIINKTLVSLNGMQ